MKLVSFSGPQSTGKTTLLNALMELNGDHPDVTFVPEVTRRLKREFNVPINQDATVMTQLLIMGDHYLNVHNVADRQDFKLKILDRCSLDGEVYCNYFVRLMNMEHLGIGGITSSGDTIQEWGQMAATARRISEKLMPKYDLIFLPDHRDVPLVDDGERSADVEFRNDIIDGFEDRIRWYQDYANLPKLPKFVVLSGTVEQRLAKIKEELTLLDSSLVLNFGTSV